MAGTLTVNLALQKSRVDNPLYVKKLNVCGVQLDDISVMQQFPNLEVCSFSVNKISDLSSLSGLPRLTELYLRKNAITDLQQVVHLSSVRGLRILGMAENPICEIPDYRAFVIAACPNLVKLDDADISGAERAAAEGRFPDLHLMAPPAPGKSGSNSPRATRHHQPLSLAQDPPSARGSGGSVSSFQDNRRAPPQMTHGNDDVPIGGRAVRPTGSRLARTPPRNAPEPMAPEVFEKPAARQSYHTHHASSHNSHAVHHVKPAYPPPPAKPAASGNTISEEAALNAIFALLPELSPSALSFLKAHITEIGGQ